MYVDLIYHIRKRKAVKSKIAKKNLKEMNEIESVDVVRV